MISKLSILLSYLTMTPEAADKIRSASATKRRLDKDDIIDMDQENNGADDVGKLKCLPTEFLTLEKWNQDTFIEGMMILTENFDWVIDDLSIVLQVLSGYIDEQGATLSNNFNEVYYVPRFQKPTVSTFSSKDWLSRLRRLVQGYEDTESTGQRLENSRRLKSSILDYCSGLVRLDQLGVGTSKETSTTEPDLTWEQVVKESENDYKKFMKLMVGMHGMEAVTLLLTYLQQKALDGGVNFNEALEVDIESRNRRSQVTHLLPTQESLDLIKVRGIIQSIMTKFLKPKIIHRHLKSILYLMKLF
jgi:hypothetical protein